MDGNGTLEFAEFVILMTSKMRVTSIEEEISDAFVYVLTGEKIGNVVITKKN